MPRLGGLSSKPPAGRAHAYGNSFLDTGELLLKQCLEFSRLLASNVEGLAYLAPDGAIGRAVALEER